MDALAYLVVTEELERLKKINDEYYKQAKSKDQILDMAENNGYFKALTDMFKFMNSFEVHFLTHTKPAGESYGK